MLLNKVLLNAQLQVNDNYGTIDHTQGQILPLLFPTLERHCRDLIRHSKAAHRLGHAFPHLFHALLLGRWLGCFLLSLFPGGLDQRS